MAEGNVGAGAGATVGKMLRSEGLPGMKGGLGTASLRLGEVVIGAVAADVVAEAIDRGVKAASSVEGWPCSRDFPPGL